MGQTHLSQDSSLPSRNFYKDDEIDLKELLVALWKGKLTIIVATLVCAVIAVAYALLAKQVWTTEAVVTTPQINSFSNYSQMVSDLQPAFDIYQEDGTVLVSKKLDDFALPKTLFDIFIQQFESRANKKAYLSSNSDFKQSLEKLNLEKKSADDRSFEDAKAGLYSEWYKKLSLAPIKSNGQEVTSYTLQGLQDTSEKSFDFLNGYVQFVAEKTRVIALANIDSVLVAKRSELSQQEVLLTDQAKARLINEHTRAKYALEIAKAAGINKPQQNLGNDEMFSINIGANALAAKVKVLGDLKQLSIIEPRLQQISAKLSLLSSAKVDPNLSFDTYQFIENPEKPLSRTSPKRTLIAILGVLLGGMLGCAIVLVRHAFREK